MTVVRSFNSEAIRLEVLRQYHILDTAPESNYDDLTRLAAQICQTPVAIISLVDAHRQWFKSKIGWHVSETPRDVSFCTHAIRQSDVLVVPDASQDERFAESPLVQADPAFRFYAGAPLISPEGFAIGTLCVLDWKARSLTPEQESALQALSRQVMVHLELRRKTQDLSEAVQQRQQIETDQELFFAISPDLICVVGFDGYFKRINPSWERTLGYSAAELMTQPFIEFVHPDDRPKTLAEVRQIHQGRQTICFENRYRCQDGSYRWLLWNAASLPDRQLIYAAARDITDRKRSEEILQHSLQELEDLKFAMDQHAIVAITDRNGTITYANERFCELSQYSAEELIGHDHRLVNSGYHPKSFFADLWQTITAGNVWQGELCNRAKDGSLYWVHSTIVPVVDEEGQPYQYIAVRTDITRQKRSEASLRERSHLSTLNAAIGTILSQGGSMAEILERCAETMVDYLGANFARIWTIDSKAELLELQAIAGHHSPTNDFPNRIPIGISLIGYIAQTQTPYTTNDVLNDICISDKDWLQNEAIVGFVGYPLVVEDRLVGVMALFSPLPFTEAMLNTLSWISNSIAVAIDRTWAREELLSRREAFLFRLASQIRDSLNLDVILTTTVTEIRGLLQVDRCHFLWCWTNGDRPDLVITHEARDPDLPTLLGDCPEAQVGLLARKVLNLEMIRVSDVSADEVDPETQHFLTRSETIAQLMIPLETRSGQLGAIVCSHNSVHLWTDSEVELLQAVVDQVAIAIDQAELYAKTRAAAFAAETQAKQLSEALQNLQHTQAQLIQTEKMSSLGQMVAGIAHEINNPVNFINGNIVHANNYTKDLLRLVQLYQQYYPDPVEDVKGLADSIDVEFIADDLPKLLASMKIGADRIRQIVLSLRNFSRLDEAEKKPVDIHEGIDSTLLILHNRLRGNGSSDAIEVIKEYGHLPLVECYAGQLNQVFMNILANAIDALDHKLDSKQIIIATDFLPDDPVTDLEKLFLSTDPEQQASGTVIIRIRDNGLGMSDSTRAKLFDPFFTTKPVGSGTGLGMSISYQIVVQKHGGSLECQSSLGQGSEFMICIPSRQKRSPLKR